LKYRKEKKKKCGKVGAGSGTMDGSRRINRSTIWLEINAQRTEKIELNLIWIGMSGEVMFSHTRGRGRSCKTRREGKCLFLNSGKRNKEMWPIRQKLEKK